MQNTPDTSSPSDVNGHEATQEPGAPAETGASRAPVKPLIAQSAEVTNITCALANPFPYREISWRVGTISKDSSLGQALPYIDARDVQARLDTVLGIANWTDAYVEVLSAGKLVSVRCKLSVRLDGEWITKEDAAQVDAYNNETSAEMAIKGAYSDALKRAAVKFGVGRYLYSFKAPWVELENERYLPVGFNGLVFMSEHMVPPEELAELKALHAKMADLAIAAMEATPLSTKAPARSEAPARASSNEAGEGGSSGGAVAAEAGNKAAVNNNKPEVAGDVSGSGDAQGTVTTVVDDAKMLADITAKIEKGESLTMLVTYLNGPKARQKLSSTTRDVLLSAVNKKMPAAQTI